MSDYCNPLTDDELLSAKIVYPQAGLKTEDVLTGLAANKTKKQGTNLTSLHREEVKKHFAQLDESAHKSKKLLNDNDLSTGPRLGKQSANIMFKFAATGKVSNEI